MPRVVVDREVVRRAAENRSAFVTRRDMTSFQRRCLFSAPSAGGLRGFKLTDGKHETPAQAFVTLWRLHGMNGTQDEELAVREFVPTIEKIIAVSSFSTPSTWQVETDRGPASLVLKAEEDIRRLGGRTRLLIAGGDGMQFRVKDTTALDRHSRKLLERFL